MSVPGLRREDFPVLDRLTYLNTASTGLVPASVVTPAHEFELELAQAGTTGMDEDTEIGILEDARHGAAALLGASPDTIAIATSFTEALNQVAWWLRPGRGQNVVSSEVDFPSVTYPWHRIAEDTGCQVRLVGVLDDPDGFDVNKIADSVDSATAAICISHIQYLTGHLLDLADLAALAHDNGAILIVDATQSAGQVPIDVTASGVDVLISGSYKWLCSTFGAAVCYLSPALLANSGRRWWAGAAPSTPTPSTPGGFRWPPPPGGWSTPPCPTPQRSRSAAPSATSRGLSLDEVAAHNARARQPARRRAGPARRAPAHPARPGPPGRHGHRPLPRPRRRGHRRRAHQSAA